MYRSSSKAVSGAGRSGGASAVRFLPLLFTALAVLALAGLDAASAAARSDRPEITKRDTTSIRSETVVIDDRGIRVTPRGGRAGDTITVGGHDGVDISIGKHGVVRIDDSGEGGDRVEMGDDVEVGPGEIVHGDAVSIGGDVRVRGRVMGDVVAIGGNVTLADSAYVGGDAVTVGGDIDKSSSAYVGGQAVQIGVSLPNLFFPRAHLNGHPSRWGSRVGNFFFWLVFYLVMFAFAALALYLARDRISTAANHLAREPFQASMTGLLSPLLVLLAFVLLIITLIGIPVALALFFLYPVFVFLGWVVAGYRVGQSVGNNGPVTVRTVFIGLLVISGLHMLHVVLRLIGVGGIFDFFIKMAGFTVSFVAAMIGVGAIICTRFRRAPVAVAAASGMVPPAPPAPPGGTYTPPSAWPAGAPPAPPAPPEPPNPFTGPASGS